MSPPTEIFACDHGCRQVSWLAGRYPSSHSQDRDSQWHVTKDSPLTVAGAAAELGRFPRTAFPFDPWLKEPSGITVEVCRDRSQSIIRRPQSSLDGCALFAA